MGVVSAASILNQLLAKKIIPSKIPTDPRSLTSAIISLLRKDDLKRAVSLLFQSTVPVPFSLYSRLFRVCSARQAILEARKVECHLITFNPTPPTFLLNRAIEAFGKCGCLADAKELFDEMPKRDGGSWNALITAYAQWDRADKVFRLFLRMGRSDFAATEVSYAGVLRCCGIVREVCLARQVHGVVVKCGFGDNVILQSSLVDVYGKCGLMEESRRVFDEMKRPNEVSWNVIVRRYLEAGNGREAISVFFGMVREGICPLNFTVSNVLIACARVLAAKEGMQIHGYAVKVCLDSDEVVCSSLICLYLKCDELEDAQMVFDQPGAKSIVSWTSMVSGYAFTGRIGKARELFDEMPERNIISWNAMLAGYVDCKKWDDAVNFLHMMCSMNENIDHVTLSLASKVATGLGDIDMGKQLHGFVYRHGYSLNSLVANSLLDMYGKCRNFKISSIWFDQMNQSRDSVSWNSFLASYARHGMSEHAMEIFGEMHWETMLSEFTCGTLLAACANTSSLNYGKQIHAFILRNEYDIDVVVRGALVDMYSKCRYIDYGLKVFKEAALRDIVLWNSIILGCCYNGKAREALKLYKLMVKDGPKPDNVTMQGLLLACVLEGRVDLGRRLFKSMSQVYNIIPRLEHHELMVRLYSCHGRIDELETFIKTMPFDPTVEMLKRILKACKKRGLLRMENWASNLLTEFSTTSHAKMKM